MSETPETSQVSALALTKGAQVGVPDWLAQEPEIDNAGLKAHVKPPRIKVLQSTKGDAYADFSAGAVITVPTKTAITSEADQPFHIVPLLFFEEFCTINPLQMKDSLPMVRARSLDPKSEIAIKAKSNDLRLEPCPEKPEYSIRHVQYLNFIVLVLDRPGLEATPMVLSFSRGEYRAGANFASLIVMRRVPMFGCVFKAVVPKTRRKNQKGQWYGIDMSNPTDHAPFLQRPEDGQVARDLHLELKKQLDLNMLVVDHDEEGELADTETPF